MNIAVQKKIGHNAAVVLVVLALIITASFQITPTADAAGKSKNTYAKSIKFYNSIDKVIPLSPKFKKNRCEYSLTLLAHQSEVKVKVSAVSNKAKIYRSFDGRKYKRIKTNKAGVAIIKRIEVDNAKTKIVRFRVKAQNGKLGKPYIIKIHRYLDDKKIDKMIEDIVGEVIKDDMTDAQKVYAIAKWMKENITYDLDSNYWDPALAFKERRGVCENFAYMFDAFMDYLDIPVAYADGRIRLPHVWNKVRVDGIWYNVDTVAGLLLVLVSDKTMPANNKQPTYIYTDSDGKVIELKKPIKCPVDYPEEQMEYEPKD